MRGEANLVDKKKWTAGAYALEEVMQGLSEARVKARADPRADASAEPRADASAEPRAVASEEEEEEDIELRVFEIKEEYYVEVPLAAKALYGDSSRHAEDNFTALVRDYTRSCKTLTSNKRKRQDDAEEEGSIDAGTCLRKNSFIDKSTGQPLPRMISVDLAFGVLQRPYIKVLKKSAHKVTTVSLTPSEANVKSAFFKFTQEMEPTLLSPEVYDVVKANVLRAVNPRPATFREMEEADAIENMCAFVASMRDFSSCSDEIRAIVQRDLVAFFDKHPKRTAFLTTEATVLQPRKKI
jgi:hypothetical protein